MPIRLVRGAALGLGRALLAIALVPSLGLAQVFPSDDAYVAVQCSGGDSWDPASDGPGANSERDIVGEDGAPAVLLHDDGDFLFLRLRIAADPSSGGAFSPFGWGFEIDTDGSLDTYELLAILDGIAGPEEVVLARNDVQASLDDPSDPAETVLGTYVAASHAQTSPAGTVLGGGADFFLTIAVPILDLEDAGVDAARASVVWAGTSSNARSLGTDMACHDGDLGDAFLSAIASDGLLLDPDGDLDGDGLTNEAEAEAGTDPADTDSDDDGLPDPDEVGLDTDGDGIDDALEPDDDGDGIPTADEIADDKSDGDDLDRDGDPSHGDTDSDGDGFSDAEEGRDDDDGDGVPDYLDPADLPDAGPDAAPPPDAAPETDASVDAAPIPDAGPAPQPDAGAESPGDAAPAAPTGGGLAGGGGCRTIPDAPALGFVLYVLAGLRRRRARAA